MELVIFVQIAAAIWLVALGIRDLRRREYVWGGMSVLIAAGLLLVPFPTHAVSIDLPSQRP